MTDFLGFSYSVDEVAARLEGGYSKSLGTRLNWFVASNRCFSLVLPVLLAVQVEQARVDRPGYTHGQYTWHC